MTDYRLLYPTEFIGAADLQNEDRTVTISRIAKEKLPEKDGSQKEKVVAFFSEFDAKATAEGTKPRRLVLNKTNAKTIAKLYGKEIEGWSGRRVTLFPTTCQSFGETVDCVRVRPSVPATAPAATATKS